MRRSAAEVIRNLEQRIAKLEKQSSDNWWDSVNYGSEQQTDLRKFASRNIELLGFTLDPSDRNHGSSVFWYNSDLDLSVYIAYYVSKGRFEFTDEDGDILAILPAEDGFDKRKFLATSKKVLSRIRKMVKEWG